MMRLRSGFAWLLSGNVLYSACQLGIVWVLARLGDLTQVGQYALGMAVSAPILMLADFQLRAIIASDVKEKFSFGQYFSFRIVAVATALAAIVSVAFLSQAWESAVVIVAVGIAQALEFLSDTYYAFMQREHRLDRMSRSLMIKGPVALAALATTLFLTKSILAAIAGLAAGRLVVLLSWDSRLSFLPKRPARFLEWDWKRAGTLLGVALPLGIVAMLTSVNANIPRYFLEAYGGKEALGVYAPIASLLTAGTLAVSAMGQTLFVSVAQAHANGDSARFRGYVQQASLLGVTLGCLGIILSLVFGGQALAFVFGAKYAEQSRLLVLLTCAGAVTFVVSGLGYIITAAQRLRPQVPLMLVAVVASLAASAWFIPRFGAEGAPIAIGISGIVQLAGTGIVLARVGREMRRDDQPIALATSAKGVAR